jgi:hypothetical protein
MDYTLPCIFCKYFNRDDRTRMTCAAFPNGIPKDIQELKVIHNSPVIGDHNIQYEPLSESIDYFRHFKGETRQ